MIPINDYLLQLYEGGNEDERGRDFTGMFVLFSFAMFCCSEK